MVQLNANQTARAFGPGHWGADLGLFGLGFRLKPAPNRPGGPAKGPDPLLSKLKSQMHAGPTALQAKMKLKIYYPPGSVPELATDPRFPGEKDSPDQGAKNNRKNDLQTAGLVGRVSAPHCR